MLVPWVISFLLLSSCQSISCLLLLQQRKDIVKIIICGWNIWKSAVSPSASSFNFPKSTFSIQRDYKQEIGSSLERNFSTSSYAGPGSFLRPVRTPPQTSSQEPPGWALRRSPDTRGLASMRDAHTCPSRWGLSEGAARRKGGAGQGRGRDVTRSVPPRLLAFHSPASRPAGIRDSRVCRVRCWGHSPDTHTSFGLGPQPSISGASKVRPWGGRTEREVPPPPPNPCLHRAAEFSDFGFTSPGVRNDRRDGGACDSPPSIFFISYPSLYYPLTPPPAKGVREIQEGWSQPWVSGITCHLTSIVRNCFHLLRIRACLYLAKFRVENSSKRWQKSRAPPGSPLQPFENVLALGLRVFILKIYLEEDVRAYMSPVVFFIVVNLEPAQVSNTWSGEEHTHTIKYYATIEELCLQTAKQTRKYVKIVWE